MKLNTQHTSRNPAGLEVSGIQFSRASAVKEFVMAEMLHALACAGNFVRIVQIWETQEPRKEKYLHYMVGVAPQNTSTRDLTIRAGYCVHVEMLKVDEDHPHRTQMLLVPLLNDFAELPTKSLPQGLTQPLIQKWLAVHKRFNTDQNKPSVIIMGDTFQSTETFPFDPYNL